MNKEIKEILDKAKENYKLSEFWTPEIVIDILKDRIKIHTEIGLQRDVEQDIVLLDYITNLEQENEDLKKGYCTVEVGLEDIEVLDKLKECKSRIDKAIEMINKCLERELNYITYKGEEHLICGSDFGDGAEIILDILTGGDEE